jgi:hypothetical protein
MAIPKKKPVADPFPSIEDLVRELIAEPDKWLDTKKRSIGRRKAA